MGAAADEVYDLNKVAKELRDQNPEFRFRYGPGRKLWTLRTPDDLDIRVLFDEELSDSPLEQFKLLLGEQWESFPAIDLRTLTALLEAFTEFQGDELGVPLGESEASSNS